LLAGAALPAGAGAVLPVLAGDVPTGATGAVRRLWVWVWVCVGAAPGLAGIPAAGARAGSDGIGSPG
jgi:hypothetical protein